MRKRPESRTKQGKCCPARSIKKSAPKPKSKSKPKPIRDFSSKTAKPNPKREPKPQKQKAPRLEGTVLWGLHAVAEAWLNPNRKCLSLRVSDGGLTALQDTLQKAESLGLSRPEYQITDRAEIDTFLPRGTVHQGILLETKTLPPVTLDDLLGQEETPSLVVLLDQVTDPHNVGAVLRSAAALGADAVIVTERKAPQTTGILAKTACGAVEHIPLIPVVNLTRAIKALQGESFWCIGLAEEGKSDLASCTLSSGKIALVLGAEGDGLRRLTREHCDELVHLPTQGPIGSLNVSNAAAVALYEVKRQKS
ncbi:MAG TPA: 23S rRNA (guanosine(2251)-2'-O)-methyltransferase RlmB [Rhodospirillaceae bacterium]|nr:23S rRNA (guanosine(2251)-2'-O)-methyltransferase RlmB [Rhodospirillaceae bacterium]